MNILHTECSMNWGGQEYRTVLEHNYLNGEGHSSWIMCHPDSVLFERSQELGCKNIVPMNFSRPGNIAVALRLLLFCRKNGIDVINSHGSKDSTLSLLAFLFGIPLIRSRQVTLRVKKRLSYQYFCTHIIAAAEAIKKILTDVGVDGERITVIGEGVDLEAYRPENDSDALREEFGLKASDRVIVNIGMIRGDKGQNFYLEAAKRVLEAHGEGIKFFLVGEGVGNRKLEIALRKRIEEEGLSDNFIMTGYREDVSAFIHLADLVVIASVAVEAQSRIVPQSFATKRTVVSTDVGGLTELVKDEVNGLVVPQRDVEAMAHAMTRLIEDNALRNRLAEKAYEMAREKLSFKRMMNDTLRLYGRYAKASRVPSA